MHMELLMGCPDNVLLVFAETAALAYWKTQERLRGTLSTRELIRRGDAIERSLVHSSAVSTFANRGESNTTTITSGGASADTHMHPPRPSGEHNAPLAPALSLSASAQPGHAGVVDPVPATTGVMISAAHTSVAVPAVGPAAPGESEQLPAQDVASTPKAAFSTVYPTGISVATTGSPDIRRQTGSDTDLPAGNSAVDLHRSIADVFRQTAALYLQTVINEPSPGTYILFLSLPDFPFRGIYTSRT